LENDTTDIFEYLWTIDREINWGIKNLEFLIVTASAIKKQENFEVLLKPKPFSTILKSLEFQ
jgi:hypothetical protein